MAAIHDAEWLLQRQNVLNDAELADVRPKGRKKPGSELAGHEQLLLRPGDPVLDAKAWRMVCRFGNRHNCSQTRREDARPCTDPRHREDADAVRDVLTTLGLRATAEPMAPPPPVEPEPAPVEGPRRRPMAVCHTCGSKVRLRVDGSFETHRKNIPGMPDCPASGDWPPGVDVSDPSGDDHD